MKIKSKLKFLDMVVGLTSSSCLGMKITQLITRDLWTFRALFVKLDAMEETSF
jgi:hypothetical protein